MKVLYPDNYASSFASVGANTSFPVANVNDEHPKHLCKGTTNTLTVIFSGKAGANGIAVFNTNATSITVTISFLSLGFRTSLVDGRPDLVCRSASGLSPSTEIYDTSGSASGALWVEYTTTTRAQEIKLVFSADSGTIIQVGVIKAGVRKEYDDPFYEIDEGLYSFDIPEVFGTGEVYISDGDTVRTFGFNLLEDLDPDWWEFMLAVSQQKGMHPIAWRLLSNSFDREWVVYARFNGSMPTGRHSMISNGSLFSYINISIIEVL